LRLCVAGWPVAGDGSTAAHAASAIVTGTDLTSLLHGVPVEQPGGEAAVAVHGAGVAVHDDAGPLGSPVRVPWLEFPVRPGGWVAALVELSGRGSVPDRAACRVTVEQVDQDAADQAHNVRVEWPDGRETHTCLPTALSTYLSTRTRRGSHSGDPVAVRARTRALVSKERG